VQAAHDEALRGECAKAFALYKNGNLKQASKHLQKLIARHPAHPLLHYAYGRLAHLLALEQRDEVGIITRFNECLDCAVAATKVCSDDQCLLHILLLSQLH